MVANAKKFSRLPLLALFLTLTFVWATPQEETQEAAGPHLLPLDTDHLREEKADHDQHTTEAPGETAQPPEHEASEVSHQDQESPDHGEHTDHPVDGHEGLEHEGGDFFNMSGHHGLNDSDHHGNGHGHHDIHVASWNYDYVQKPLLISVFIIVVSLIKVCK